MQLLEDFSSARKCWCTYNWGPGCGRDFSFIFHFYIKVVVSDRSPLSPVIQLADSKTWHSKSFGLQLGKSFEVLHRPGWQYLMNTFVRYCKLWALFCADFIHLHTALFETENLNCKGALLEAPSQHHFGSVGRMTFLRPIFWGSAVSKCFCGSILLFILF